MPRKQSAVLLRLTVVIALVLTALATSLPAAAAPASPAKRYSETLGVQKVLYVATASGAGIRTGPNIAGRVVDTVAYRHKIVAQRVMDTPWYKIGHGRYVPAAAISAFKPVGKAPTGTALDKCINRVDPGRTAIWKSSNPHGSWGTTDMNNNIVWVNVAKVPARNLCDVVYHEWVHIQQARWAGTGSLAVWNTNKRILGKTGMSQTELERVADCGAQMLGATWTWYGCRTKAERLLAAEVLGDQVN